MFKTFKKVMVTVLSVGLLTTSFAGAALAATDHKPMEKKMGHKMTDKAHKKMKPTAKKPVPKKPVPKKPAPKKTAPKKK